MVEDKLDTFRLTVRGRDSLDLHQRFYDPTKFVQFRLHDGARDGVDINDMVPFEAMLELTQRGWSYEVCTSSRKIEPYQPDAPKKWYYHKRICKYYLRALLKSEELFRLKLRRLYHFQPAGYYKALIALMKCPSRLESVKPWQTRAYYVLIQNQAKQSRNMGGKKQKNENAHWDMEEGNESGQVM